MRIQFFAFFSETDHWKNFKKIKFEIGHIETATSYFFFIFFYLVQIRNQHFQKPLIIKYQD